MGGSLNEGRKKKERQRQRERERGKRKKEKKSLDLYGNGCVLSHTTIYYHLGPMGKREI